jgi:hypothetical protein
MRRAKRFTDTRFSQFKSKYDYEIAAGALVLFAAALLSISFFF